MKLFWLNAGLLLPLDKGGKLRTWHLMRQLARRHDISYLSFADPSSSPADVDGMREVASEVVTIARSETPKGTRAVLHRGRALPRRSVPYAVAKYRSREYRAALERLLARNTFDAVVCDFLVAGREPAGTIALSVDPVYPQCRGRNLAAPRGQRGKPAVAPPSHTAVGADATVRTRGSNRFDLVLAVSETDRQTFERLYPGAATAPVHVVQTGVDTAFFSPVNERTPARRAHLVFTGSMDWLPNEDGMEYFVREIFPWSDGMNPRRR